MSDIKNDSTTWKSTTEQLTQALQDWAQVDQQSSQKLAPDEQRLKEISDLLKQLKIQMANFTSSEDSENKQDLQK